MAGWPRRAAIASLALNGLGGAAVTLYLRRHGVRAGARSMATEIGLVSGPKPDSATFARRRFGGLPGAPIVFFGDSHIADGPLQEIVGPCAVRGIGGQTIADATTWVDQVLYPETTRLVIEVGANDALTRRSAEQERADYAALLHRVRQLRPDITVVLLTVPGPHGFGKAAEQVNAALGQAAAVAGVQVVDIAVIVAGHGELAPRYSLDGIHMNGAGYAALATLLQEAAGR